LKRRQTRASPGFFARGQREALPVAGIGEIIGARAIAFSRALAFAQSIRFLTDPV
jgi:hypothetical protein